MARRGDDAPDRGPPSGDAECLFMTNTQEQVLLAATDATRRRQQIANELVKGIPRGRAADQLGAVHAFVSDTTRSRA